MENVEQLLNKTKNSKVRFDELTELIARPEIIADNREWKKLVKERSSLEELAMAYENLSGLVENLKACESDLKTETDFSLREMFEEEINI